MTGAERVAAKARATTAPIAPAPAVRVKWEYGTAYLPASIPDVAAVLNDKGADGWEAFHVEAGVAYLKRVVVEVADGTVPK